MSIRFRLVLAFMIAAGLGIFFLTRSLLEDLRPRYLEAMEESMVDTAAILAAGMSRDAARSPDGTIDSAALAATMRDARSRHLPARIYEMDKSSLGLRVYVTDAIGTVVYDSDEPGAVGESYAGWRDVRLTLAGEYGARTTRVDPDDVRSAVLYVAAPIVSGEAIRGCLTVCKPADSVTLFIEVAKRKIIIGSLLATALVALLGAAISFWITRPIERLTRYARDLKEGYRTPAPELGPGELRGLGLAFEDMREALEGRRYVEQYVQTLTHEMKSPLSAIRASAELLSEDLATDMAPEARARFLRNIRVEAERLRSLVDRLLQLSALENQRVLREISPIDLPALAASVIDDFEPQLQEKRMRVERRIDAGVTVRGERFLVRQALANILQNAIDFSADGGVIDVAVRMGPAGAVVEVADRGPGVPDFALAKVFERFYSLARPKTGLKGTGLGLTFVREVTALHGGEASLTNRDGGGALATMTLPERPPTFNSSTRVAQGGGAAVRRDAHDADEPHLPVRPH